MMGGSETVSGAKDGAQAIAIHVPIGWQRRLEGGQVLYISPSGTCLSSLEEVKAYLLTDGTCKCGLECPLVIQKVFNFGVGVKVEQHSQPLGKAEQDMTKLCNHRRKVVAMATLCRSMQASQLPFATLHPPERLSGLSEHREPKRTAVAGRADREEEERCAYPPKAPAGRAHGSLQPSPSGCTSPRSSPGPLYPYNGSSPLRHASTNSHHALDALRRLQHPHLPSSSSASSSTHTSTGTPFPYSAPQRSPRTTPTPQNLSQRSTPKTPETPSSPRLGPLSPPPPSSPLAPGLRHAHGSLTTGSPLALSPAPSPSINCVSPRQRSRHASSSSLLSEQGGGDGGGGGGGLMGSNFPPRRNSTSSSPRSPLPGGSPSPGLHFSKYKLEDILEQFKNSGNSSTNNHNHLPLPANAALLANQSSSNIPHNLSLALDKVGSAKAGVGSSGSLGPLGFGSSGLPLGVFLNHHQSRPPHPTSFPASSLLSAAAKAQLASQTTQGSHVGSNPASVSGPVELLKDTQQQPQQQQLQLQQQQQQSLKVKNSTLHHNPPPSSISASRHPSPHSAFLFPPSHPLAQSLVASAHHVPPVVERSASHRKRHRQSPTVLSMLRETQQLANGPRKTPPGDALSTAIINLSTSASSSSFPPSSHPSSTSATHHSNNAIALENHYHLPTGQIPPRLPSTTRQIAPNTGPPRQMEALDFTTGLNTGPPLGLDPPTQPLSALLHLLSVQNAHASAAATISASAQLGSLAAGKT